MNTPPASSARGDVYSLREVALAAGIPPRQIAEALAARGVTVSGDYLSQPDAVRLVRVLTGRSDVAARDRAPLTMLRTTQRRQGLPLVASGALHAGLVAALILATTLGFLSATDTEALVVDSPPARLVYLLTPGPGGGGGGGGLRSPLPPPPARREARTPAPLPSPVPPIRRTPPRSQRPAPPAPPVQIVPSPRPPPVKPPPVPSAAVFAAVRSAPSDVVTQAGLLDLDRAPARPSNGPGQSGGVGSGRGTGLGQGDGSGIGPGSGGGTGGGPYRPGSGVTAPTLLREVRPTYTQEARRRGIEGDVTLQIVVRRDGSISDVRVVRSLGAGLDEKAVEAVRQWKFGPATRQGQPVDVLVNVSVAFTLR
jgi:TonB family protein